MHGQNRKSEEASTGRGTRTATVGMEPANRPTRDQQILSSVQSNMKDPIVSTACVCLATSKFQQTNRGRSAVR
jgi:hypothetical protein